MESTSLISSSEKAAPLATFSLVDRMLRRKDLRVLTKKKKLSEIEQEIETSLRPVLSVSQLTALGVGMIIGAGIFTIIGKGAHAAGDIYFHLFILYCVQKK